MQHFDVLVVGNGLVGAAAAKYLSAAHGRVAVIGPAEPSDYHQSLVFASHYDQARVQRMIGKNDVRTRLNIAAAAQYDNIQAQSGIRFHVPVGCLYVNPYGADEYLAEAANRSRRFDLPYRAFHSGAELATDFPEFRFPEAAQGLLETDPSGFIQPRQLLEAQRVLLEQRQGVVLRETVLDVRKIGHNFQINTREGHTYLAPKVLLAAGSFVNFFNLLPHPLALKLKSEVVLLARVSSTQAQQMGGLPSLLYEIDHGAVEGIYLIQPVQYPDGHFYLKMGCNMPEDIFFERIEQVQDWFRRGDSEQFSSRLQAVLHTLMPGAAFDGYLTKRCIISRSVHERPYIGETAEPGLYVASGCNGYSAMCSDAIGSVAAHLVHHNRLPEEYQPADFEVLYQS